MTADGHSDGDACKRNAKAQLIKTHTSIHDAELRRGVACTKAPWLTLKQRETYYNLRLGYRLPYRMNRYEKNRETSHSESISISHSAGKYAEKFALLKRNLLAVGSHRKILAVSS
jgi:hypothetical protein